MNINKVMVAGRLTRDVEVKFLANERAVCEFSLAINRRYRGKDGEAHEEVTFLDCEAWGKTAELMGQYMAKGRGCFVEGYLKQESWEDKQSGQKRSKLKIVADSVQFLDRAQKADGEQEAPAPQRSPIKPAPMGGGSADILDPPPFAPLSEWG